MQDDYVIDLPNDLDSLEQDMNNWLNLPYDLQKIGNDNCIAKYGMNNHQLFNILKAKMLNLGFEDNYMTNEEFVNSLDKSSLQEASRINIIDDKDNYINFKNLGDTPAGYTNDGSINERLRKIDLGNRINNSGTNIFIINDFLDDKHPDYTIDELEKIYNNYIGCTPEYIRRSDNESIKIWGATVAEMYNKMKAKFDHLQSKHNDDDKDIKEFIPDKEDQQLYNYNITISQESGDILQSLIRKLDCYMPSKNRSLYESAVLENFGNKIKIGSHTYRQDMPGVLPFLYYYEYVHNTNGLDERKIQARNPFTYVMNAFASKDQVREAYEKHDNEALLEMGWNPYVKPTDEAFEYARQKQINYLDEYYNFDIYDVTRFYTNRTLESLNEAVENSTKSLSPIFLVVSFKPTTNTVAKAVKDIYSFKDFSKIGICLSEKLNEIYTYTDVGKDKLNRMETTSISEYGREDMVQVMCFFVSSNIKKKIKEGLKYYIVNQDNSQYAFDNITTLLADAPRSKHLSLYILIAQFLDSIFKISNIYDNVDSVISRKKDKFNRNPKIYIMHNGKVKDYKDAKINKNVKWLQKNVDYDTMNFFADNENKCDQIEYYNFDSYLKDFNYNPVTYETARMIRECLTPTEFISEEDVTYGSISLYPKNGNDLESFYNQSHEILSKCNANDIECIKKQLDQLCYIYNVCVFGLEKLEKGDPALRKLEVLKNTIEIDINMYLKVVKQIEPDFNLRDYVSFLNKPVAIYSPSTAGTILYKYDAKNFKLKLDENTEF